jgi:hexosaminidase
VLANAANLYFDQAYAKHPEEPGYYWPGFIDTRQAFEFCPLDAALTARADPMGQPLAPQVLSTMELLARGAGGRIVGLQGQLWAENARTQARLEYLAAPRLIALAERAWAPAPEWQLIADPQQRAARIEHDWNEFANRLGQRALARLDSAPLAYGYRLPPPGVMVRAGALHANVALPGLALHYTVDGSEPGAHSALYRAPVAIPPGTGTLKIATFDSRGRKSRTVTFDLEPDRHA